MWACTFPTATSSPSRYMLFVLAWAQTLLYLARAGIRATRARGCLCPLRLPYRSRPAGACIGHLARSFTRSPPLGAGQHTYCGSVGVSSLSFNIRAEWHRDLAFNAVLFTVYIACCIHFLGDTQGHHYRHLDHHLQGFLAWAFVFVVAPVFENIFTPTSTLRAKFGTCPNMWLPWE